MQELKPIKEGKVREIYDNGELQKDQFEAALEMFNGCEI